MAHAESIAWIFGTDEEVSLLVLYEHRSLLISIHTVSNPGLHFFTPQQEYYVLEILKEHQGWVHPSSTHRTLMLVWNTEEECTNGISLLKTLAESFFFQNKEEIYQVPSLALSLTYFLSAYWIKAIPKVQFYDSIVLFKII